MLGAVINALNTRLDAATIKFILDHGESNVLIVDTEFVPVVCPSSSHRQARAALGAERKRDKKRKRN